MARRTADPKPKKPFMSGYKTYDTSNGFGNSFEWRNAFKYRMGLDEARERVGRLSPRAVLGLLADCMIWDDIRTAYLKLAMAYHPDRAEYNGGGDEEKFKTVLAAYEILKLEFGK